MKETKTCAATGCRDTMTHLETALEAMKTADTTGFDEIKAAGKRQDARELASIFRDRNTQSPGYRKSQRRGVEASARQKHPGPPRKYRPETYTHPPCSSGQCNRETDGTHKTCTRCRRLRRESMRRSLKNRPQQQKNA